MNTQKFTRPEIVTTLIILEPVFTRCSARLFGKIMLENPHTDLVKTGS